MPSWSAPARMGWRRRSSSHAPAGRWSCSRARRDPRRRLPNRRADAPGLRARRLLRCIHLRSPRPSSGAAARRHGLTAGPTRRAGGAPARRRAGRDCLERTVELTASGLGADERAYRELFAPLVAEPDELLRPTPRPAAHPAAPDPTRPLRSLRGLLPATEAFRTRFREETGARFARRMRGALDPAAGRGRSPRRSERSSPSRGTWRTGPSRRRLAAQSPGARLLSGSSAESSRPDGTSVALRPPRPRRPPRPTPAQLADIDGRSCPPATSAGSGATATAPACSSSTGRSTDRSRGATRVLEAATVHLGGTLDEIAAPKPPWAGGTPSVPSCWSCSRACSTLARAGRQHTG